MARCDVAATYLSTSPSLPPPHPRRARSWILRGTYRLCAETVSAACLDVNSANSCYDETYMARQARMQPARAPDPPPLVVALPAALGGAALLAAAAGAVALLVRRRRRAWREREAAEAAAAKEAERRGSRESDRDYRQAWSL